MLLERIESEGLAHYSYLIGDGNEAVVIDPRRDAEIYADTTVRTGFRLAHILETHRNEDYVIGSLELAARTGAEIWHADGQLPYRYGQPVKDGQSWTVGRMTLQAIPSPGHTPGSMSYLLRDTSGAPWIVFTGDALFAGAVGRVDLLGVDRAAGMADSLYDTLFSRLLPLGDEVIVCPGHGAGSVCGTEIADRPWTTVGLERRLNPKLRYADRIDFVANAFDKLERPPYFLEMERLNVEGAPILSALPLPKPLSPAAFADAAREATVVDIRMPTSFASAHVPGAISIWEDGVPGFAGWFLTYDRPILLVTESDAPWQAVRHLVRLGFTDVRGFLAGGMQAWLTAGYETDRVETTTVQALCRQLDGNRNGHILDLRSEEEVRRVAISGAQHVHITQLPLHLQEVPRDHPVGLFCASGMRSMIGASLLRREQWENLTVVLGGLDAWSSTSCPLVL